MCLGEGLDGCMCMCVGVCRWVGVSMCGCVGVLATC